MMQCIWNIYVRQPALFMRIANEILDKIEGTEQYKTWKPSPKKERDTRWLTNGRNAEQILIGYYIQDENGTPFWVLLAERLALIKRDTEWQCEQLNTFIKWMMNPDMILGLWIEAEAVQYFEASYHFHARGGELCERPGFRCLELFRFITDHAFPWWEAAKQDPKSRFPKGPANGSMKIFMQVKGN